MDNLTKFNTQAEYDTAKYDLIYPNVSYIKDTDKCNYVKKLTWEGGLKKLGWSDDDITKFYKDSKNALPEGHRYYAAANPEPPLTDIDLMPLDPNKLASLDSYIKVDMMTFCPMMDTSQVTDMSSMFGGCRYMIGIPLIDTSKATNMEYMFGNCLSLSGFPKLDTSNVTNMKWMFSKCITGSSTLLKTIPQLDTSKVTNMEYMFDECSALTTVPKLNISNVLSVYNMLNRCSNLSSIEFCGGENSMLGDFSSQPSGAEASGERTAFLYENENLLPKNGTLYIDTIQNPYTKIFYQIPATWEVVSRKEGKVTLSDIGWSEEDIKQLKDNIPEKMPPLTGMLEEPKLGVLAPSKPEFDVMALGIESIQSTDGVYNKKLRFCPMVDTSKITDMRSMFNHYVNMVGIPQIDTSNVTDMGGMFSDCISLINVPQLNTSNVTDVSGMFKGCISLISIPELDFSLVTELSYVTFFECTSLTNLGGFKGLKVSLDLSYNSDLTHDSLMNVINKAASGVSGVTLTFGATNLAKLSDAEKKIATDKGWTLA